MKLICAMLLGFVLDLIFGDPHGLVHPVQIIGWFIDKLKKGMQHLIYGCSYEEVKEKGIESRAGYPDKVQILENINKAFGYGTDIDFAKELFNIPLPERYQWLEDKVDSDLRIYQASFEDYNEVIKFIEKLKGGDNG